MAYDRDGTVGFYTSLYKSGTVSQMTETQLRQLNDENSSTAWNYGSPSLGSDHTIGFIFPDIRSIAGILIHQSHTNTLEVETSADTTNGLDGTWTTRSTSLVSADSTSPFYRSNISSVSWSSVKGLRWSFSTGSSKSIVAVHLFGAVSSPATRLALWHPTLDQEVTGAYFDWGDVPRGTSSSRTFRVKNMSSTQTANSIGLSMEALTDTTPTVVGQHSFSSDGLTFSSTLNIGSLAPSSISNVLTLKRITPSDAALSVWAARIVALPGSWT